MELVDVVATPVIFCSAALASSGLALSGLPSVAPTRPTVQVQSRLTDYQGLFRRPNPQVHDLSTSLRIVVPLWDRLHIEAVGSYDRLWEITDGFAPYQATGFDVALRLTAVPVLTEHFRLGVFVGGGLHLEGGLSLWAGSDSTDFLLSHGVKVDLWFPQLQAPRSWSEVSEKRITTSLDPWGSLPEAVLEQHIARWHRFRVGAVGPIPVLGYGLVTEHVSVRLAVGTLVFRHHAFLAVAGHL